MAQILRYKQTKALSQSSLKLLDYDPKSFYYNEERWLKGEIANKPEFDATPAMRLGEVVDCLALTPKDFDSIFVVNTALSPSGQMLTFTDEYIKLEKIASENYTKTLEKETVQQIAQSAYDYAGFKRDSFTKVLDRFKDEGLAYYNTHRKAKDKIIITAELYKQAQELTKALKDDKYANDYMAYSEYPWQEILNQHEIYMELSLNDTIIPLKALLDRVVIDHDKKTIQPIDLKTTSEDFFPSSIVSYRYDMQAAFYTWSLQLSKLKTSYRDYVVLPFLFITVNTVNSKVIVWELSDDDMYVGKHGGQTHTGRVVKGFLTLIEDYTWYKNNNWDYPKDVQEQEGKRITNCFVNA